MKNSLLGRQYGIKVKTVEVTLWVISPRIHLKGFTEFPVDDVCDWWGLYCHVRDGRKDPLDLRGQFTCCGIKAEQILMWFLPLLYHLQIHVTSSQNLSTYLFLPWIYIVSILIRNGPSIYPSLLCTQPSGTRSEVSRDVMLSQRVIPSSTFELSSNFSAKMQQFFFRNIIEL